MYSAYTKGLIQTFVAQYGKDIVTAITDTNLFFPTVVAQLSVESGNGTSKLATNDNNFGGIKGDASNGVAYDTTEVIGGVSKTVKQYFRKFDDFPAFMQYYVSNLQSQNYVDAGVFAATSPEDQITAMVNGGYSTMSPSAYLASGVKDRIDACRDTFQGLSRISSVDAAVQSDINPLSDIYQGS
jgi:flagellum-specific peptidoglycan hydrolase FlgJ